MASWKEFSTRILRSLPEGSSAEDHARALREAGRLWRIEEDISTAADRYPKRNPESDTSLLLYGVGAIAAYLWIIRPNQSRLASWLTPPKA